MAIPKRIIQTARSHGELTTLEKACISSVRSLCPDYEYLFFDDAGVAEFVRGESPKHREVFEALPIKIQKIDFFRYLAVYRLGGFYFDTDLLLGESIDEVTGDDCVFPFEAATVFPLLRRLGLSFQLGNYAFGAAAGHPFIQTIIDNVVRAFHDPAWCEVPRFLPAKDMRENWTVYHTTGPVLVSRTYAESAAHADGVHVLVADEPRGSEFGRYGVHLLQGSWKESTFIGDAGTYMLMRRAARQWRRLPTSERISHPLRRQSTGDER